MTRVAVVLSRTGTMVELPFGNMLVHPAYVSEPPPPYSSTSVVYPKSLQWMLTREKSGASGVEDVRETADGCGYRSVNGNVGGGVALRTPARTVDEGPLHASDLIEARRKAG